MIRVKQLTKEIGQLLNEILLQYMLDSIEEGHMPNTLIYLENVGTPKFYVVLEKQVYKTILSRT